MIVIMDMASGERTVDDSRREPPVATEVPRSGPFVAPRLALREVSRPTAPPAPWAETPPDIVVPAERFVWH